MSQWLRGWTRLCNWSRKVTPKKMSWTCILVALSFLHFPSLSASHSQPEISVTEIYNVNETYSLNSTCAFHSQARAQCFVPWNGNISSIEMECIANYPVGWSVMSILHPAASGLTNRRTIGEFGDPSTYKYSTTVQLKRPNLDHIPTEVNCHALAEDTEFNHTWTVTFNLEKYSESLQVAVLHLNATREKGAIGRVHWQHIYANSSNPNFIWSFSGSKSQYVKCCIKDGVFQDANAENITFSYGVLVEPGWYSKRYSTSSATDSESAERCLRMEVQIDDFNPNVYTCQLKNVDAAAARSEITTASESLYIHFKYQSVGDGTLGTLEWSEPDQGENGRDFFVGDKLTFQCHSSPFFYAIGMVWELGFHNETSEFRQSNNEISEWRTNRVELTVDLTDDSLESVSCHVPPWNSTGWITRSMTLRIKPSSKPISLSQDSVNVTFYTGQSVQLHCDFTGDPQPQFRWITGSEIYLAQSEPNSPENSTISVSFGNWDRGNESIPPKTFYCRASNVAGYSIKAFNLQAIESFPPAMINTARQAVVLHTNNERSSLNCTITQGVPMPDFIWQKHGQNISTSDDYEEVTMDMVSFLIFKKVRHEDEAEYTCIAHNFRGSVSKEFSVRVRDLPQPPPSHWHVITITVVLAVLLATGLVAALAYVYVTKTKKIGRLEAQFTKSLDTLESESHVTVRNLLDM